MSQAISAADATETPLSVTPVLDRQAPLPSPPAWAMVPAFAAGIGTAAGLLLVASRRFASPDELGAWLLAHGSVWFPPPWTLARVAVWLALYLMMTAAPMVLHELGHLGAGLAAGFAFDAVRLGPFLVKRPLRVSLYRGGALKTSGAAHMIPGRTDHFRLRCSILVLGGPLANLLSAAALLALPYPKGFYSVLFVFLSLAEGLSNLIPFQTRLAVSDGGRLSMLWRGGPGGERFMALLRMQGALARGASAGTLAADDLAKGAALRDDSPDTAAAHVIAWAAAYGLRQDQEAAELLDVALRHSGRCEPAMRLALISDAGVFQARRRGRVDLAEAWLAALPTQLPMPWLRGRIEIALLEARGDVAGARERLEERERDLLKMPDPVQRELLLAHLRNWQSELLEREKAGSR